NNCRLWTAVEPTDPGASDVVSIELTELPNDQIAYQESDASETEIDLSNLRVCGHVAMLGDVVVGNGTWISGPNRSPRIEGFAIEWPDKPEGIVLRYAARIGGPTPTMTKLVEAGNFVGTRGRALPLTGLGFELSGTGAQDLQLMIEAAF